METVLVLPIILLILLGIISYGLYINAVDTIQQAARVGARSAAIGETFGCPGDSAQSQLNNNESATVYGQVDDQINESRPWMTVNGGTNPLPVISYAAILAQSSSQNPQESDVEITIAYPYAPLIPLPGLLPSTIEITKTYQMMVETPQPSSGTTASFPSGSPYYETTEWTTPSPTTPSGGYLTQPPPTAGGTACSG
ncbi:MAG: pilus assembly protein [Firmicutes bacterium]|nr:pilus assembly protein [Bacillota bacterium]